MSNEQGMLDGLSFLVLMYPEPLNGQGRSQGSLQVIKYSGSPYLVHILVFY
jgi:hypothetical protein